MQTDKIKLYTIIIACILTGIMYQYFYTPIFEKTKTLQLKRDKAVLYLKNLKKEKQGYGDIKKSFDKVYKEYKNISSSVIKGSSVNEVGENLQKIVLDFLEKNNIKARNYSRGRTIKKDKYYIVSVNFNIDVDINQFYDLISHFNNSKYLIRLDSVRVDYDRRHPQMLRLSMSLSTIYIERGKNA